MNLFLLILVLLIFSGLTAYFFCLTFVRKDVGNVDNLDDPINKPLTEYKELMQKGMDYIHSTPHTWVYTTSFDGLKLAARYFNINSKKTIILFHGYRSTSTRDFSTAVRMYNDLGLNVLLCDQRSHGKSEGRLITFGVKESRDVLSWIEYANGKFKAENIILGGMSMGATTVLLSTEYSLPEIVKGIIADCGFSSPYEIIKIVGKNFFKVNATLILPIFNLLTLLFGKFSIYKSNTLTAVEKSNVPILLIHGENDTFVPCDMSERLYEKYKDKCRLVLVPKASHGVSYFVDTEKVEKELESFLNNCLIL